ncbi:DUF1998 domain-containing protein [Jannaschia sp. Os4]|uniref:DUF1998 domain-containing protein n=1 Tax=Jannaschia sp. Os4 TaxID=2807617 RepID=UPI0019397162|nr:DUF1998 domain-containing protein [Jannaschia sp. Os4]MBM2575365.1 DUF1998 domain-containing protein [Jannaschia sp. Os4]
MKELGEVRRSQVLGYGPGAIIDFRAGAKGGGPVSALAVGLHRWPQPSGGNDDPQIVHEVRLQKLLGKSFFLLPPVSETDDGTPPDRPLPAIRFPNWLLCPECRRLDRADRWGHEMTDPARWCEDCSTDDRRVFVVPSRFVTACENGHLDEFPWRWWLRRRSRTEPKCAPGSAEDARRCRLYLEGGDGTGLESLRLVCKAKDCGAITNMAGAFSKTALEGRACSGRRGWIDNEHEDCDTPPRALQRGASNLYFPVTFSTLSIPPWTDNIQSDLSATWDVLIANPDMRNALIAGLASSNAAKHGLTADEYADRVRLRLQQTDELTAEALRFEEYERLSGTEMSNDFQTRAQDAPDELSDLIDKVVRVERLREVRALVSFTRIYQSASYDQPGPGEFSDLSPTALPWLPAVEVRGEGIFIRLRESAVRSWSERKDVSRRAAEIDREKRRQHERDYGDDVEYSPVSPPYLLVHSLAHAVIRRLSFDCGYDAASLRERLYVGDDPFMAGLLVYTATSDADGTLGGLERQGRRDRIAATIRGAVEDSVWCASDPLCRSGVSSASEPLNGAACHGCLLLPETSCENGNRFLDRSALTSVGSTDGAGYFDCTLTDPTSSPL